MKAISLLFFLSFINAQIALPTFQGVHKPHTSEVEPGNTTFNYTGSSQTFTVPDGDNHQSKISAVVTFDSAFSIPIYIDGLAPGQYEIQPHYWNYSEEILSEPIPFRILE